MSDADGPSVDGRRARRDRNREAVIAATMDILNTGDGFFGLQEVAERSGVSLRSVHRYFEDSEEVALAAIDGFARRHRERVPFTPPVGTLVERIDAWVEFRLDGHREVGLPAVAALARANRSAKVAAVMEAMRWQVVRGVESTFRPELDALPPDDRQATLAMAHSITLIEAWENLVQRHGLTTDELRAVWRSQLRALFDPPCDGGGPDRPTGAS